MDWKNIEAIIDFRDLHPEVKMIHFLNPIYFLPNSTVVPTWISWVNNKPQDEDFMPSLFAEIISKDVLREGDEVGIHIHAWNELLRGAGVAPHGNHVKDWDGHSDGYGVPLWEMKYEDIVSVLKYTQAHACINCTFSSSLTASCIFSSNESISDYQMFQTYCANADA